MNIPYLKYALGRLLHGLVISRKPGSWLARLAFLLVAALLTGWIILGMQSAIAWVFATLVLVVLVLLAQSSLRQIRSDYRDDVEHQVLVIGVGDTPGLMSAIPSHIRGQRISYEVQHPLAALKQLLKVEQWVAEALHCQSPAAIKVVYAGNARSPVAFLMGFYLGHIRIDAIMDSVANSHNWQLLDGGDDAARFEVQGLQQLATGVSDVTVIMRCEDDMSDASSTAGIDDEYPVLTLQLNGAASSLMSSSKQNCLANQFGALLQTLADHGVATVHMHYAGPHSLLFNLGRQYRHSPLPVLIVYAQEPEPEDSWGLRIPSSAHEPAEIVSSGSIPPMHSAATYLPPVFHQTSAQQQYKLAS